MIASKNYNLLKKKELNILLNLFFKKGKKKNNIKFLSNTFQILRYKLTQSKIYISPLFVFLQAIKNLKIGLILKTVILNKKQKNKKKQNNLFIPFELTPIQSIKNSFKLLIKLSLKNSKKLNQPIDVIFSNLIFNTFLKKGVAIKQKLYFQKFLSNKENWFFKFSRYKLPPKIILKKKKNVNLNKLSLKRKKYLNSYKQLHNSYHKKKNINYLYTVYSQLK